MFVLLDGKRLKYIIHIIIIILVVLQSCYVSCKNTNKKVYYFENETKLPWIDALNFCRNMNMTLLTVRNKEEFDFLKSIIRLRYNHYFPWWLDAYKLEGVWKWISSGDNIKEFFWHEGEPNDKSGNEKCIHIWGEPFDWNDNDCELKLRFICEAEYD